MSEPRNLGLISPIGRGWMNILWLDRSPAMESNREGLLELLWEPRVLRPIQEPEIFRNLVAEAQNRLERAMEKMLSFIELPVDDGVDLARDGTAPHDVPLFYESSCRSSGSFRASVMRLRNAVTWFRFRALDRSRRYSRYWRTATRRRMLKLDLQLSIGGSALGKEVAAMAVV